MFFVFLTWVRYPKQTHSLLLRLNDALGKSQFFNQVFFLKNKMIRHHIRGLLDFEVLYVFFNKNE